MVCDVCRNMLRRQTGRLWRGSYDLKFDHHSHGSQLHRSAQENCGICRSLYDGLQTELDKSATSEGQQESGALVMLGAGLFYAGSASLAVIRYILSMLCFTAAISPVRDHLITELELEIEATLFVHKVEHLYRLDMVLQQKQRQIRVIRTFLLENPKAKDVVHRPRTSSNTSSKEVFETAVSWMQHCTCASPRSQRTFYPARLVSLEKLKAVLSLEDEAGYQTEHSDIHVNVVETKVWFPMDDGTRPKPGYGEGNTEYVTLSHCWGKAVNKHHTLTSETYEEFTRGIPISRLPKTFRDAIHFAARLKHVGYIWIDSLCIKQGDNEDWLHQSGDMDRVYSETYLNLSATASANSEGGLFLPRDPRTLKEEHVLLNIEGLPGAYIGKRPQPVDLGRVDESDQPVREKERPFLRPCTILDASFWATRVDMAPVNKRGWVLQERLLSPRVLHFCRDQIAWECYGRSGCNGFDAAEGQPRGMSKFKLTDRGIVEGVRLKALQVDETPRKDQQSTDHALKLWARIVETYSKTALTVERDKLIAIAGMAKKMAPDIQGPWATLEAGHKSSLKTDHITYVAGLWRTRLATQLLWRVEPKFDPVTRSFSHPAKSHPGYRAPSFSWAAIDVDNHGIMYADIIPDRDLFVKVSNTKVVPLAKKNPWGLVETAKIEIWGRLRRAHFVPADKGRFAWYTMGRHDLDDERHTNVYLDCPTRDTDIIGNPQAKVYVMPAAKVRDPGSHESGDIICLILRLSNNARKEFQRIGVTKLTPYMDKDALSKTKEAEHKILEAWPSDGSLPHDGWKHDTGMHKIWLI